MSLASHRRVFSVMGQVGDRDMATNEAILYFLRRRATVCTEFADLSRAATRKRASCACRGLRAWHCRRGRNVVILAKARGCAQEHFGIRVQGGTEQLVGIDQLHQFAAIQHRDLVGQLPHHRQIV